MLSDYERRVLSEIESSLSEVGPERALRRVARAGRLPAAAVAFIAVLCLALATVLTGAAVDLLIGLLGAVFGWQLCRAARGHAMALRLRRVFAPLAHRRGATS